VVDPTMFPQGGRVVLVMLKDGRQLEGELNTMTDCYAIGDVVFEAWEIETLEDVT
jgi:hypothetical protein